MIFVTISHIGQFIKFYPYDRCRENRCYGDFLLVYPRLQKHAKWHKIDFTPNSSERIEGLEQGILLAVAFEYSQGVDTDQ
jgi:hypothetical protein